MTPPPNRGDGSGEEPRVEELADGMALWEEHKPQTGEDWVRIAERVLADGGTQNPSPIFAGLLQAVQERDEAKANGLSEGEQSAAGTPAEPGRHIVRQSSLAESVSSTEESPDTQPRLREAAEQARAAILDWEFLSQRGGPRGKEVADALFAAGDSLRAALAASTEETEGQPRGQQTEEER